MTKSQKSIAVVTDVGTNPSISFSKKIENSNCRGVHDLLGPSPISPERRNPSEKKHFLFVCLHKDPWFSSNTMVSQVINVLLGRIPENDAQCCRNYIRLNPGDPIVRFSEKEQSKSGQSGLSNKKNAHWIGFLTSDLHFLKKWCLVCTFDLCF